MIPKHIQSVIEFLEEGNTLVVGADIAPKIDKYLINFGVPFSVRKNILVVYGKNKLFRSLAKRNYEI